MKSDMVLRPDGRIEVKREPHTYNPGGGPSFFADLIALQAPQAAGYMQGVPDAHAARARLERHDRETAEHAVRMSKRAEDAGVEYRVNPNSTAGTGGEFVPPLWLTERFASAARAGRPLGDLLQPELLPPGVGSIHIPRMSTGSTTSTQSDGGAVAAQDLVTADANATVVTIAGELDVSQQLFDLTPGGFDQPAFIDLSRSYNRTLEVQLLTGAGTGNQILGVANVSGIPAANLVSGAGLTTIAQVWPAFGQACANVMNNRLLPPEAWIMAGRRLFWILSSVDGSQRPIGSPGQGPHAVDLPDAGGTHAFGPIVGLPAYPDGAVPAGATADTAYALRPSDCFLWESTPRVMAAVNATGGTLQVRLSYHRYVAFIPQRYPSGIGAVTGLPAPANF